MTTKAPVNKAIDYWRRAMITINYQMKNHIQMWAALKFLLVSSKKKDASHMDGSMSNQQCSPGR